MKRPKGPELKMPQLKVPDFLVNLYWDLRDRRLLPLVALAIVAIFSVPFLLGGGSKKQPLPVAPVGGLGSGASNASKLTVVEAKPGLRDYRKRLAARSATDPFKQRYTSPNLSGTKLGGGTGELSSTSSTTTSTSTTETSNGTTTTEVTTDTTDKSSGGAGSESQLTLYSFAIDVKIVSTETKSDGSKQTSKPTVRHGVMSPSPLPGDKTQVITYMGLSPKTHEPLLLVSDEVTSIYGDGKCLSGAQTCQLIEVEPGFPETFVFGPDSTRYKINVLKVQPVAAGHT